MVKYLNEISLTQNFITLVTGLIVTFVGVVTFAGSTEATPGNIPPASRPLDNFSQ
jgi:hypothetical protein